MASGVAGDELGVVEIVARVHAHALRQPPAQRDLARLVEQRDLDAVDLGGVGGDDVEPDRAGAAEVAVAPIAYQRGIDHDAEPVADDTVFDLAQRAAIYAR